MVAYLRDRTRLAATRYMKRHMFVKKACNARLQCSQCLPLHTPRYALNHSWNDSAHLLSKQQSKFLAMSLSLLLALLEDPLIT